MHFSGTQITFLQRLVKEKPASRQAGVVARYFSEHFSIGSVVGNAVEYRDLHFELATKLLQANDLPLEASAAGASRAEVAGYGGMSEKMLSVAPHADSVALKSLGRCTLDGQGLYTPAGAYLVLPVAQALRVTCQRVMVVENFETFRFLESYSWLDRKGWDMLAVYRGERDLSNKEAAQVIKERKEPLWAFVDFDPAGLVMANAMPQDRLERLVLPSFGWLAQAADTPRGRQLYDAQVRGCENALDAARHPDVKAAWQEMKRLCSGVTQERMLAAPAD